LHSHEFDTVLGRISFNEKGEFVPKDLTDYPAETAQ
jgi:hypothetical protein